MSANKSESRVPAINSSSFWDELYRHGGASWDLGSPTPVFLDLLEEGEFPPGRTLVLGCGKGYDAIAFSTRGYQVTAVDFSGEALREARRNAGAEGASIDFVEADLFSLGPAFTGAFDYVVEYVTFCAIDPLRRKEYVDVVHRCLRPGGRLIALLFPLDTLAESPPFSVPLRGTIRLFSERLDLLSLEFPIRSIAPRKGREVLTVWLKG